MMQRSIAHEWAGLLGDLAKVRAMHLRDVRDLWFQGDGPRCSRVVGELVRWGLVAVREFRGDRRQKYVVLGQAGVEEVMRLGLVEDEPVRGTQVPVWYAEQAARESRLYVELVKAGLKRDEVFVGAELRRELGLPNHRAFSLGVVREDRVVVLLRPPVPWRKHGSVLQRSGGVDLWVLHCGSNRSWWQQVKLWVKETRPTAKPMWVPQPARVPACVVEHILRPFGWLAEVAARVRAWGIDLVPGSGGRVSSGVQRNWWLLGGAPYALEDLRPVPVHVLRRVGHMTGEEYARTTGCAGVLGVVGREKEAERLAQLLQPGSPCLFLVLESQPGRRVLRRDAAGLVPVI